jgi:small subunit ribosomal protein S17
MSDEKQSDRAGRKVRVGIVASDKMTQTVTVVLERRVAHPRYGKQVKVTRRVKAHDETGAGIGDKVRIMETRPLSKTKRWRVVDIVTRAQ